MNDSDATIVALSSGPPPCGIAVVRASGQGAAALAEAFSLTPLPPRRAVLRSVCSPVDGALLDRALCLFFPAPGSATGEDILEVHLHGGPALVERVLGDAVTVSGVRVAEPGEFTLRAVLNGRMGLPDAEALADLIDARSEGERRRATRLSEGALSTRLSTWRERLVRARALAEAHLDFADEGDVTAGCADIDTEARPLRDDIADVLHASGESAKLTDGYHIALVGPPNAGKSSLLNALAGEDAAIVSDEAGTTRDVVAVALELGGYRVTINDTAGLREGAAGVEALGISRTERVRDAADLVVEVRSPDTTALHDPAASFVVMHKADLLQRDQPANVMATSLHDPRSIAELRDVLSRHAASGMAAAEAALVTRARQRSALGDVVAGLDEALAQSDLELKAEGLRFAIDAMARMTGEIGIEDVLDDVFGRFCIGK